MASDDLFHLSIGELAELIRARTLSPVELTRLMLARIEVLDDRFHAYVTPTAERALADARRAEAEIAAGDYKGPLHGVPIALKDLVDTAGIETAAGTKVMAGRVPTETRPSPRASPRRARSCLGKLAMTEGAFRAPAGAARTAQSLEPQPLTGVSSSGSGVAVAAGLAFAALGTDTGGLIRFPRPPAASPASSRAGAGSAATASSARRVARPCRADRAQRRTVPLAVRRDRRRRPARSDELDRPRRS